MTPITTSSLLLLLFVLVSCSAATVEWKSAVDAPSRLNAVWSSLTGGLNISQLNPATGAAGETLFLSNEMEQMFPASPALDVAGKRLFVPVLGQTTVAVAVFDLSTPGKASLQKVFPVTGTVVFAVQYDSVNNTLWLLTSSLPTSQATAQNVYVTSVDLSRSQVHLVGTLPPGSMPSLNGLVGGSAVIDEKNRELVIAALQNGGRNFTLVKFNLNTHQVTTIALTMWPCAMARDVQTGTVYALFQSKFDIPLAFGSVDTVSGKLNIINQWSNPDLVNVVGAAAAYDALSGLFYSLVDNGQGLPVWVVTVSAKSGQLMHAAYADQWKMPYGLFVF